MANLLIEMGNTALKAAWSEGNTLGKTVRYQGEKFIEFIYALVEKEKPEVFVMATVRDLSKQDEEFLAGICKRFVLINTSNQALFRAYQLPEYLSPDRAAGIIAVRRLFQGKECLLFDFGTTLSIDFISRDGNYRGGNVSLGLRTRLKAVNRYARSLPLANTPKEDIQLGTSTLSGIEAGVLQGIKFEVDGYIAQNPESVIVFTGGDANYFSRLTKNSVFVVNNLVLMGLATIAMDYEKD